MRLHFDGSKIFPNGQECLQSGHCHDELWALDVNRRAQDMFATGGDDGLLRIWSLSKFSLVDSMHIDGRIRSIAWSNSGNLLAVGLKKAVKRNSEDL